MEARFRPILVLVLCAATSALAQDPFDGISSSAAGARVAFEPATAKPASAGFDPREFVKITTGFWQTYRDRLDLENKIGDPEALERRTQAALSAARRDLARFVFDWRLRARARGRVLIEEETAANGSVYTVETYDDEDAKVFAKEAERIFRSHLDEDDELPDLLAYLMTKVPHIRENWRAGIDYEQKILDHGWVVALGVVGVQAARDRAKFKVDVGLLDLGEGKSVEWRTRVSQLGVSFQPRVQSGVMVDGPWGRVEALAGGQVEGGALRRQELELSLKKRDFLDTGIALLDETRWSGSVGVPLDDDLARDGERRSPVLGQSLYWSSTTASGGRRDSGFTLRTRTDRLDGASLFSAWSSGDLRTRVFGEVSYHDDAELAKRNHRRKGLDAFVGVSHRF